VSESIVVVGGGQVALQLCLALRKENVDTPIIILCEEDAYPYHRPPLSKAYLSGDTSDDDLLMRPQSFYKSKSIDVRLATAAVGIDRSTKTVSTSNGDVSYSHLVIATGAAPRALPVNNAGLDGVHMLRDLQHARCIKRELAGARQVVVIGAGFIGLEFAAMANSAGKNVTVLDMADRVMARAVSPTVSQWFLGMHVNKGIDIRLQESMVSFEGDHRIESIEVSSGDKIPCDLMVVGIGVVPNTALAEDAGLKVNDGIVVDEYCKTSDPFIFAAGDCARHPNPFARNETIRLESIQNATDQARVIAASIGGKDKSYNSVPWFWSDQGEHGLKMAGLSNGSDQFVTRGDLKGGAFSVFHFSADQLQSVDSVNSPRDHMLARKLIAAGIHPTADQAADSGFDLKTLLP